MVFRGKKACHVACGETYAKRGTTTVQFLESLEANGADLEELDERGQTLLSLAVLNHCDPGQPGFINLTLELLLFIIFCQSDNSSYQMCWEALRSPVVSFLKNKVPVLVDKPDKTGRTALHLLGTETYFQLNHSFLQHILQNMEGYTITR